MMLLDSYCTLTYNKYLSSFLFVSFDLACKQQLIVNLQMLMHFMCLYYFQLCHHPVILFLCHVCQRQFYLLSFNVALSFSSMLGQSHFPKVKRVWSRNVSPSLFPSLSDPDAMPPGLCWLEMPLPISPGSSPLLYNSLHVCITL